MGLNSAAISKGCLLIAGDIGNDYWSGSHLHCKEIHPLILLIWIKLTFISIYTNISHWVTYESATDVVDRIFLRRRNINLALQELPTSRQSPREGLEQYLQRLKTLSRVYDFQATTTNQAKDESIKNTLMNGLESNYICQI